MKRRNLLRFFLLLVIGSVLFLPQSGKLAPLEKKVLLTFDDGPDIRYTPQILATLKQYEVKALFFVVGS